MKTVNFVSVPNQRNITIHRSEKRGRYTKIKIDVNLAAMKILSYSAFMLYSYFCHNADGYNLWMSKAWLCENTALTKNTYYKAFNELEEKGYIVRREGTETFYDFYDTPCPNLGTPFTQNCEDSPQKTAQNIYKYTEDKSQARSLNAQSRADIEALGIDYNL